MTTKERLEGLKNWVYDNLCKGKNMKQPSEDGAISTVGYAEPGVYVGWYPTRPDRTGTKEKEPDNLCPSILLMFGASKAKAMQEQRFDRYSGIQRPKEMGATLAVSMLFTTYEPGIRLAGFADNPSPALLREATEDGLYTLTDWMDEARRKLIAAKHIPGTDLFPWEDTITYAPYMEMGAIADMRPLYYGFINCEFGCYADEAPNSIVNDLLN